MMRLFYNAFLDQNKHFLTKEQHAMPRSKIAANII